VRDLKQLKEEWYEHAEHSVDYEGSIQIATTYIFALEVHMAVLEWQIKSLAEKAWKYDELCK